MYLDELTELEQRARHAPLGAERRNESRHDDQAGVDHQFCDLGDAADVLDPVGIGESEVTVEAKPHIVAIEYVGAEALPVQAAFQRVGDR